jgi:hypothetical protein
MSFEVIRMKQLLARAVLLVAILSTLPGIGLLASGWEAGDYWVWQGSMEQSPSFTTTTTIYVLQGTSVLDRYELDVLGQIFRVDGQITASLGTLLRDHNTLTSKGYHCRFQDGARWGYMPPGTQVEEKRQLSDLFFGDVSSKQLTVVEDACVDVDVLAGKFACCSKLLITNHSESRNRVFDRERVLWFSFELGWPVRIEQHSNLAAESYKLVNEFVELGHVSPEEAALRVLSAIDEMKAYGWSTPDTIFIMRKQLLSLGLLQDEAP